MMQKGAVSAVPFFLEFCEAPVPTLRRIYD